MWKKSQSSLAKAARTARYGLALFFCLLVLLAPRTSPASSFPDLYDDEIQRQVDKYWVDLDDWLYAKAQLYQESNLRPQVCSQAGACGIGQFLGGTWRDTMRALRYGEDVSRFDARIGIEAFAYYQAKQRYMWRRNRTPIQANELGQAGYNAGAGHILKAQALCNDARLWDDIVVCLPKVTGDKNAAETRGYIINIRKWRRMMEVDK